jgi:hypothetical protein
MKLQTITTLGFLHHKQHAPERARRQ